MNLSIYFKSSTIQVITMGLTALIALSASGEQLGLSVEHIGYIEKAIFFITGVLGIKGRVDTENKPRLKDRK